MAALRHGGDELRRHRRRRRDDLHRDDRRRRAHACGSSSPRTTSPATAPRRLAPTDVVVARGPAQHERAERLRQRARRQRPHRRPRRLDRHARHHVRLPVAALRRPRRPASTSQARPSRTYTTTGDDVGAALRVAVTATNAAAARPPRSDRTGRDHGRSAAQRDDPARSSARPRVGETLAVDPGTWSGTEPLTFSYQWQRCDAAGDNCAAVAGETERDVRPDRRRRGQHDPRRRDRVRPGRGRGAGDRRPATRRAAIADPVPRPAGQRGGADHHRHRARGQHAPGRARHWTGTDPIAYTYQWQRCDADGTNCVERRRRDLARATRSRTPTSGTRCGSSPRGTNSRRRVLGHLDADRGGRAGRDHVGRRRQLAAGPDARPTPSPSAGADDPRGRRPPGRSPARRPPRSADLSSLPGSQVSSASCAALVGGGGFRRTTFAPAGAVRMRVRADAAVLPTAPVRVTVNASKPQGPARRALHARRPGAPGGDAGAVHAQARPGGAQAGPARARRVAAAVAGAARACCRTTLRVAACATRFTARQYRTTTGSALRLRIDSRTATTAATFALPAAVTGALGLGTPAGRIRVVTPAGARQYKMTPARGRRPMGLGANAAGRPGVRIRGRTVVVTGPARPDRHRRRDRLPAAGAARSGPARAHPPGERGRDDPRAGHEADRGAGQPQRRLSGRRPSALRRVLGADAVADLRAARRPDHGRRDLGGDARRTRCPPAWRRARRRSRRGCARSPARRRRRRPRGPRSRRRAGASRPSRRTCPRRG